MQNKTDRIKNFRLTLVDDETHKPILVTRFTRTTFLVSAVMAAAALCLIFYMLVAFTPVRTLIPGYPDARAKRAAIQNAMKIDSLEMIVSRWELYSENLRRILDGEEPIRIDSLVRKIAESDRQEISEREIRERDSILRMNVAEEEQFSLSLAEGRNLHIEGMHFFCPLKGVVSQGYDPAIHPFVDITAPANSMVFAVLDGSVIYSGWSDDSGYTIQIQHSNDIVSIYKHNQKLLKAVGDRVTAGDPIAVVGNTGTLTTGDHLHFELWYRGEAVDPTRYINF
ncbi:MAG: M23 family metallopeptidase [Bacteroidetes bacterium]|uniref:M23 family metallopeptidase n=1 Tax=Candidatus Cryptobacteroides merdigallinarum TaxID=2840770 RepID=A0A9D9HEZ1_9BACT|nr:M23 family metallopeptidase [Candidatus Cryptobacteroides merdigallinarum]